MHFAFLAYYPLSDYQKLINFDAAYYIVLKSKFNLMFSVCQIIIIIYGNKALFTDANIRLIQLLENIIVKNDSSCFSIPTHKRKNLCKVIQRNFMAYLNLFQSVITITSKMKFFVWLPIFFNRLFNFNSFYDAVFVFFFYCFVDSKLRATVQRQLLDSDHRFTYSFPSQRHRVYVILYKHHPRVCLCICFLGNLTGHFYVYDEAKLRYHC